HVILRGANSGPNYDAEHVAKAKENLEKAKLRPNVMIDCSHGNSSKDHRNQPKVSKNLEEQIINGEEHIVGLMIESHLNEGKQSVPAEGPSHLKYGVSITDACVDFDTTVQMLEGLSQAIKQRRANKA
ncbi:hypothetical protein INT45_003534, partial [Circinella minor]